MNIRYILSLFIQKNKKNISRENYLLFVKYRGANEILEVSSSILIIFFYDMKDELIFVKKCAIWKEILMLMLTFTNYCKEYS